MLDTWTCTRGVEVFLKKTAIAYHQNSDFLLGFGRYAISKNASTSRVAVKEHPQNIVLAVQGEDSVRI